MLMPLNNYQHTTIWQQPERKGTKLPTEIKEKSNKTLNIPFNALSYNSKPKLPTLSLKST